MVYIIEFNMKFNNNNYYYIEPILNSTSHYFNNTELYLG